MSKKYITKDSGKRKEFKSGMKRDLQDDKPRFDLLMPLDVPYDRQLLTRWAELLSRGSKKYGDRNWEKANGIDELKRFKASALRHMMQWINDEDDEDHSSAILFNVQGAEYCKYKMEIKK